MSFNYALFYYIAKAHPTIERPPEMPAALSDEELEEAAIRSAYSTAYYAAYQQFLKKYGSRSDLRKSIRGGRVQVEHSAVSNWLRSNQGKGVATDTHRLFRAALDLRLWADYDEPLPGPPQCFGYNMEHIFRPLLQQLGVQPPIPAYVAQKRPRDDAGG